MRVQILCSAPTLEVEGSSPFRIAINNNVAEYVDAYKSRRIKTKRAAILLTNKI